MKYYLCFCLLFLSLSSSIHGRESFMKVGDRSVMDRKHNLIWEQKSDANRTKTFSWKAAIQYCEQLSHDGHGNWRVPNIKELWSLTRLKQEEKPLINLTWFPKTAQGNYWSGTSEDGNGSNSLYVNFSEGSLEGSPKSTSLHVRCVR